MVHKNVKQIYLFLTRETQLSAALVCPLVENFITYKIINNSTLGEKRSNGRLFQVNSSLLFFFTAATRRRA